MHDMRYVGYTGRYLHERVDVHKQKLSSIYDAHFANEHTAEIPWCLLEPFHVLGKCITKFDSLITEMLLIESLNHPRTCKLNLFVAKGLFKKFAFN